MRWLVATIGLVAGCGDVLGLDPVEVPMTKAPVYVRSASVAHGAGDGNFMEIDVPLQAAARGDLIVVAVCFVPMTSSKITSISDVDTPAYTGLPNKSAAGGLHAELFWTEVGQSHTGFNVKVLFEDMVGSPDVRVAEYSNVAFPGAVEDSTMTADVNLDAVDLQIMVSQAPALVFAATCVDQRTDGITNFAVHEMTTPNGDVIADMSVMNAGTIMTTAHQSGSGALLFQLVAFEGGTAP